MKQRSRVNLNTINVDSVKHSKIYSVKHNFSKGYGLKVENPTNSTVIGILTELTRKMFLSTLKLLILKEVVHRKNILQVSQ